MIRLTNTLTRQLEEFQPQGDIVTMYVCGVTPYDASHIGHAMSYVVFDVVKRYDIAESSTWAHPSARSPTPSACAPTKARPPPSSG